jgi:LPXTG-site transpeptidase (sortase) family protein
VPDDAHAPSPGADGATGHGGRIRRLAVLGAVLSAVAVYLTWTAVTGLVGSAARQPTVAAETGPPYLLEPEVVLRAASTSAPPRPTRSMAAGRPVRVVLPTLGVRAPVVPISAPRRVLTPPGDPQVLGWWRDGAVPGAASGGSLITGHTVHTGGGALDDLEKLRRGDPVRVRTAKGVVRYAVTATTVYRKARLAEDAERVFRQTGPGRLVLITCEDWNGSTYLSNVVVLAEPV